MIRKCRLALGAAAIIAGGWLLLSNIQPFFTATKSNHAEREAVQAKESVQKTKSKDNVLYPNRPKMGEEIGELYIPKISATLPIIHGTDEDELEKGVGHFAGSVFPGEEDNSVLSGHRDTVFRKLGEVGVGDLLIVTTSAGEFTYKARKVRIVDANDRTVIVPKPRATLTVTTCYPFDFIGDAPERYVLVADLVK
ncbi:sortase family protein [Bacillus methanolicus PB1]|uniref:Sortase family protein n=1 Tax=Bacillus methanolicus PB1 TaxID=997296 RepID=I3E2B3_BACMT|nr:class D sortase [Bacillus methanolicus]EIJ80634.1 sortase family protein [Bacillus methanolicus PB1]